jgi:RNA polymerase sigma factor (sigma-70 family)
MKMTTSKGLEFLERHWSMILKLAQQRSRGRPQVAEMLVDVAVDRVPRAVELYNESHESGCTLEEYVFDSLRRYMIKKLMHYEKRLTAPLEDWDGEYITSNDHDIKEEVQYLLQDLDTYHRELLIAYHLGYSFQEIGEALGLSKSTIRKHYNRAIEFIRARENIHT